MKKWMKVSAASVLAAILMIGCSGNQKGAEEAAGTKTETGAQTEAGEQAEAGSTAAGGSGEQASGEAGGKLYGITYWIESDFFKTVAQSITEQAEAEGNQTVIVDAGQDSAKQIQIIEDFIAQGVDAVFLNPVDRDAIEPALLQLKNAGIPVINFDSAVANLEMVDAYVATDNKQAGVLCAESMIKDFPDGGDIAVLNYPANSACVDREQGFLETIEGHGFNIVSTFDAEGTVEKGQTITSDILQANPDIVAIFGINDQCGMGAYAAVTTAGGETAIYGVDGAPEAKQVIDKMGIYKMTAAQSPIKIGIESYKAVKAIEANGKPETFQIDVPAFTIDHDNIKDYLNEGWQ